MQQCVTVPSVMAPQPSVRPAFNNNNGQMRIFNNPPPAIENLFSPEDLEEINVAQTLSEVKSYIQRTEFNNINDVTSYHKIKKIGQGTFGEVFQARCKKTGKMVALKKILMENEREGFPITALREVKMLQQVKHENVTELIEVCSSRSSTQEKDRSMFYLVFSLYEHDLAGLLSSPEVKLKPVHVKTLMKHLFNGLFKLHRARIMHRDMKTANILVSKEGVLKLADFGLARCFYERPQRLYTNRVVTLWYRPPELLLGAQSYCAKIDTWGAGCIMAELFTKKPILQGDSEAKQLELITQLCGSITPEVWPKAKDLPLFETLVLKRDIKRVLVPRLRPYVKDEQGLDLLDKLLSLDPERRLTAEESLDHNYFFLEPLPAENVKDLIQPIKTSQFEYTTQRGVHAHRARMAQQQQQQQQNGGYNNNNNNQSLQPKQFYDMVF